MKMLTKSLKKIWRSHPRRPIIWLLDQQIIDALVQSLDRRVNLGDFPMSTTGYAQVVEEIVFIDKRLERSRIRPQFD